MCQQEIILMNVNNWQLLDNCLCSFDVLL